MRTLIGGDGGKEEKGGHHGTGHPTTIQGQGQVNETKEKCGRRERKGYLYRKGELAINEPLKNLDHVAIPQSTLTVSRGTQKGSKVKCDIPGEEKR